MKAKITITHILEYEIDHTYYPENLTPEQMLTLDIEGAKEDPTLYTAGDFGLLDITVTGELV